MTSNQNVSNSFDNNNMSSRSFSPNQMSSSFRNHQESQMFRSLFISSNHTNQHGSFSSPRAFQTYQNSQSSSFGYNNSSHVAYEMSRNMVSTFQMPCMATQVVPNNPNLVQISVTQTITTRYSAFIPTNNLLTTQNDYNPPNNFNPSFYSQNLLNNHCEILDPTPLNTIYPDQDSIIPWNFDQIYEQRIDPYHRPVKRRCTPSNYMTIYGEDGEYDGRIHSLPYEKYGPYTCPKCNNVFDTSQKFAAHVSSVHYKNETTIERAKRYNARNKRKLRKAYQMMGGESQQIQPEERVLAITGSDDNDVASDNIEVFQNHSIVKEEPIYDML